MKSTESAMYQSRKEQQQKNNGNEVIEEIMMRNFVPEKLCAKFYS